MILAMVNKRTIASARGIQSNIVNKAGAIISVETGDKHQLII